MKSNQDRLTANPDSLPSPADGSTAKPECVTAEPSGQHSDQDRSFRALARQAPHFYPYIAALFLPALALGALPVARLQVTTDTFDSASGVGVLAIVTSVVAAAAGYPTGLLVDRFNARAFMLWTGVLVGLENMALGWMLTHGGVSQQALTVFTVLDALLLTMCYPPSIKVQSAMVPPQAKGTAELVSGLRLGIGAMLGGWAATRFPRADLTHLVSGVLCIVGSAGAWWLSACADPLLAQRPRSQGTTVPKQALIPILRENSLLAWTIFVDLGVRFVFPSQVVSLFLASEGMPAYSGKVLMAGTVGNLAANVPLVVLGMVSNPRRALQTSYNLGMVCIFLGVASVNEGWIPTHVEVMVGLVFVVSAAHMYFKAYLGALLQQRIPDEVRGSLTGLLTTLRNLLTALGAAVATYSHFHYDTHGLALGTALTAVAGYLCFRGFKPVGEEL